MKLTRNYRWTIYRLETARSNKKKKPVGFCHSLKVKQNRTMNQLKTNSVMKSSKSNLIRSGSICKREVDQSGSEMSFFKISFVVSAF